MYKNSFGTCTTATEHGTQRCSRNFGAPHQKKNLRLVQPQAFKLDLGSGEVYLLPPRNEADITALKTRLLVKRAPAPHTPTGLSSAQAAAQPPSAEVQRIRDLEKQLETQSQQLKASAKKEADGKVALEAASARRLSTVGGAASDSAVMHPSKLKQDGISAHKWPLGGLAELIHNAADAGAKDLSIDVISLF
jgi:hypothetical protein